MLEFILKALMLFFFVYFVWLFTGGVERGEERKAQQEDSLFIGVTGTALDNANPQTDFFDKLPIKQAE